jgi:vancomycin resistance protein VanW
MRFDGNTYAKTIRDERLPYMLFTTDSKLINPDTGFDLIYQENKVFNLKLAAKKLNGLLISPGETFSLWQAMRHADRNTPYKDGLVVINGELCTAKGGGLCQMSNLLLWVLVHSPLTIVERHAHGSREFPVPQGAVPEGVDATISEGWLDLKFKNETDMVFQIGIAFNEEYIIGSLFADKPLPFTYEIVGKDLSYFRKNGAVHQKTSIYRREIDNETKQVLSENLLYKNLCEIGYQLSGDVLIIEEEE